MPSFKENQPIYLDYAATTPTDPQVIEKMLQVLRQDFGNASSVTHAFGWTAKEHIEKSRAQVADFLKAEPSEIFFTSGATESNNLAILGVAEACANRSKLIVTVKTEHYATLKACESLERKGYVIKFLNVDPEGRISEDELDEALKARPSVVSIMMVNNETGVIQDIQKLSPKIKAAGAYFHVDAVQAVGKLPLDVGALGVDLLSLSAHKIYGPKGVGVLYVKSRPKTPVRPLFFGGSQEGSLRPGTLATHQIVGLAEALVLAKERFDQDISHAKNLSQELLSRLALIPKIKINGLLAPRVPHILNIQFPGVDAEALVVSLGNIAVSMGSACTSGTTEASHVLSAMGVSDLEANSSLRFSFGRFTTLPEIQLAGDAVIEAVENLRALSPVWEREMQ
jgi:cysteine desulfurase